MRPLTGDRFISENLLCLYFSNTNDSILTEITRKKIAEFIEICKANDKIDGTCTVDTAVALYSNCLNVSIREVKTLTNMSDASIYRFRVKMADRLKAFLAASPAEE